MPSSAAPIPGRAPDGDGEHATHSGLSANWGSIAPGRRADVILTSDLEALPIEHVIARE